MIVDWPEKEMRVATFALVGVREFPDDLFFGKIARKAPRIG
jgi:hypothetical protein